MGRAVSDAGLTVRFDDLRHTCSTKLAESQASEQTIMAIAGHPTRALLEHYSHIRMATKRRRLRGSCRTGECEPKREPTANRRNCPTKYLIEKMVGLD